MSRIRHILLQDISQEDMSYIVFQDISMKPSKFEILLKVVPKCYHFLAADFSVVDSQE